MVSWRRTSLLPHWRPSRLRRPRPVERPAVTVRRVIDLREARRQRGRPARAEPGRRSRPRPRPLGIGDRWPRAGRRAPRPCRPGRGTRSRDRRTRSRRSATPTTATRTARPTPAPRWAGTGRSPRRRGPVDRRRRRSRSRLTDGGRPRSGARGTQADGWSRAIRRATQDLLGVVLVALIAGQRGEPEESERGEAVRRRRRVVEQVLRAGDELPRRRCRW